MSPSPRDYLVSVWQLGLGTRTRDERFLAAERRADVAPFLPLDKPLRVLDLANGRLRPQYLLLEAEGHRVVGIDLINRPRAGWKDRGYQ
ncbi:MAG: methyltransferase type 11, partial [Candidatus Latescibacteria bacterium]|nr:methyltransferase type 11 [Candidatus Latescibacterota bacterium]NIO77866.1 methyltransferase type 11 [Candidatus Latescibacterota bacterium]